MVDPGGRGGDECRYDEAVIFPIGSDNSRNPLGAARAGTPSATWVLLGLHVIAAAVFASKGWIGDAPAGFDDRAGAIANAAQLTADFGLSSLSASGAGLRSLLTHQFLPQSTFALIAAAFCLWTFGREVEQRLGMVGVTLAYLVGGAAVGVLGLVTAARGASDVPAVVAGVGGGVAVLTGMFAVLAAKARIRAVVVFFMIGIFEIPAAWFLVIAVAKDVLLTSGSIPVTLGDTVAFARPSMLTLGGGYALGFFVALALQGVRLVDIREGDLLRVFAHKRRLKLIREAAAEVESRQTGIKRGKGAKAEPAASDDEALTLRAAVSEAVAASDWSGGAAALRSLMARVGEAPGRLKVGSRTHLALGAGLLNAGEHAKADEVYARFLLDYPNDAEAPHVRLLVALLRVKYLNRASETPALIAGLAPLLRSEDDLMLLASVEERLAAGKIRTT